MKPGAKTIKLVRAATEDKERAEGRMQHRTEELLHVLAKLDALTRVFNIAPNDNPTGLHGVRSGKYQHYKGNYYAVIGTPHNATKASRAEDRVIYAPLYPCDIPLFSRTVSEFLGMVAVDGVYVPRYRYISSFHDLGVE